MMPTDEARALLDARPIAIADITPSPYNTRRIYDPVKLDELAASIRVNGIIEPLIVRHMPAGGYELVAGERRYRAAKIAGLLEVPCIVRDLDDNQVLDQQLIENIQREDLHQLEEARGYQQRVDAGATVEEIVRITGKDRTTVARRLRLLDLSEQAQEIFMRGGMIPKHALMLARLPDGEQIKGLLFLMGVEWDKAAGGWMPLGWKPERAVMPPGELQEFIDQVIMRPLSAAPWSKKDAGLVPEAGACNVCPKRTGANPLLFDEGAAKNEKCLDGECYERKYQAYFVQLEAKAAAKGEELKLLDHAGAYRDWQEVNGDACPHELKGVMVSGHARGKIIRVCMVKSCTAHWGHRGSGRAAGTDRGEEKLKIERKYRAELWTKVSREVKQPDVEDLRAIALYMWDRAWHDIKKAYMDARGIEAPKAGYARDYEKPVAKLIAAMKTSRELLVWMCTFTLFKDAWVQNHIGVSTKDGLHQAAERYGVDAKQIRKEIEAEFAGQREKKAAAAKQKLKKAKTKAAQGSLL